MKTVAERAELALKLVREAPLLIYDTETSGLDWKRNAPVGYVFTVDPTTTVYVPVRHAGGGNLPDKKAKPLTAADSPYAVSEFEQELVRAFEYRKSLPPDKGLIVGHHIKFDAHMSANVGIHLGRNLSCTQNTQALINEYSRSFSLETCAETYGVQAKKGDQMYQYLADKFGVPAEPSSMSRFWELPGDDPMVVEYAEGDGVTTYEVYKRQMEKVEEEKLWAVWDIENRLIWTLFRMERQGIKVDLDYLDQTRKAIAERIKATREKLPDGFNERSPLDVKRWMQKNGHTDWPTTAIGNPSFNEKWMKKTEAGRLVIDVRKLSNLENSFMKPLMEEHVFNGRVHATLNQLKADEHGTVSGRLSCSSPNMQQIPKRDKELSKIFRRAFVADEGHELVECDYSQCEPRLFAHYSEDPNLLSGYNQTPFRDAHQVVADLLGVERDPTAKRMNMGILTGMYPKAFAGHMDWPLDRATEAWNKWFEAFPGIKKFQDTAREVLQNRGYVRTLLGRRGRLDHARFAYRAVSKIIQGGNADILKYKMVQIDEMLEGNGHDGQIRLLMTVHDAFVKQKKLGAEADKLMEKLVRVMCDVQGPPFKLAVPFVVDMGRGPDWATATFGGKK